MWDAYVTRGGQLPASGHHRPGSLLKSLPCKVPAGSAVGEMEICWPQASPGSPGADEGWKFAPGMGGTGHARRQAWQAASSVQADGVLAGASKAVEARAGPVSSGGS